MKNILAFLFSLFIIGNFSITLASDGDVREDDFKPKEQIRSGHSHGYLLADEREDDESVERLGGGLSSLSFTHQGEAENDNGFKTPDQQRQVIRRIPASEPSSKKKLFHKDDDSSQSLKPPLSEPKNRIVVSKKLTKSEKCMRVCRYINDQKEPLGYSLGRVALFRGIHYVQNIFLTAEAIEENIKKDDINAFLVSSAACKLTGINFLSDAPGMKELEAGKLVNEILNKFKSESIDLYHKFHETYTNDHERFHGCLENPKKAEDPLTQKAFEEYRQIFQIFAGEIYPKTWEEAVKRNPFVSFSRNAEHALRYGFGQKSFTGGKEFKLFPDYDVKGKPRNQYLGKLYIAILSPVDLRKLSPTFVVSKHAQNKVNISIHPNNNILVENEVSFFGYVPEGLIQYSEPLEAPNFESHIDFIDLGYERKFGVDEKEYKEWQKKVKNAGKHEIEKVEESLLSLIAGKSASSFESEASKIIEKKGNNVRIYPDVFSNYYTHISDNSDQIKVTHWLHDINAKKSVIASSPLQSIGGATTNSIEILSKNLRRQPAYLEENWASSLTTISISFCNLRNSGSSFYRILDSHHVTLRTLSLKSCGLTAEDIYEIAESLNSNRFLRTLILDDNPVRNEGAKELATSLRRNRDLKRLSLYATDIADIQPFANLFPTGGNKKSLNTTLIELNLDFNLKLSLLKQIQKGINRNLKNQVSEDDDPLL